MNTRMLLLAFLTLAPACGAADGGPLGPDTAARTDTVEAVDTIADTISDTGEDTVDVHPVSCSDGLCLVPEGAFLMGCNDDTDDQCYLDERPLHEVTLSAFEITKTEVTVAQYRACVEAVECPVPTGAEICNYNNDDRDEHPMNCCQWNMADAYCAWAGMRLCTEAEWEKAARGTDGRKYPWGNEPVTCERAQFFDGEDSCGQDGTLPVGSLPEGASPYGVQDMSGNAWEWVSDWYGAEYYAESPDQDPAGPETGTDRIHRGGAHSSEAFYQRSSFRFDYTIEYNMNIISVGIRCCRSAE